MTSRKPEKENNCGIHFLVHLEEGRAHECVRRAGNWQSHHVFLAAVESRDCAVPTNQKLESRVEQMMELLLVWASL